jgi:hypothetical protein
VTQEIVGRKDLSATIVRLVPDDAGAPRTTLARMLTGHHAQGPAPGGMVHRMQSESAVRRYVRMQSRSHPLNDAPGREDVWQQVEDVLALVPSLASSVSELDALANGLRRILCQRGPTGLAASFAQLAAARVEVATCGRVMRLRLHSEGSTRIITVRLEIDGARRLDDRTVGG